VLKYLDSLDRSLVAPQANLQAAKRALIIDEFPTFGNGYPIILDVRALRKIIVGKKRLTPE